MYAQKQYPRNIWHALAAPRAAPHLQPKLTWLFLSADASLSFRCSRVAALINYLSMVRIETGSKPLLKLLLGKGCSNKLSLTELPCQTCDGTSPSERRKGVVFCRTLAEIERKTGSVFVEKAWFPQHKLSCGRCGRHSAPPIFLPWLFRWPTVTELDSSALPSPVPALHVITRLVCLPLWSSKEAEWFLPDTVNNVV